MYFHESVNRFSMAFTTLTTVPVYEEKKCLEKPRKRQHETAPKKYPRILGNVSKDKRASIQGYFAKYPCFVFSTCLPLGGS